MDWIELETSTYQDHVIKHVLGATVLGWLVLEDAVHILLDVGLLLTIYINAEMSLMAQSVAIEDLEGDDLSHDEVLKLRSDAQLLISEGREVAGLQRFSGAPVDCLIQTVDLFGRNQERRLLIAGESANLLIETSTESGAIAISAR